MTDVVASAVTKVRSCTRALIAATRAGDADAIRHAIERRGEAVETLRAAFDAAGELLTEDEQRRVVESLALQAQDAGGDLTELKARAREDLLSMARSGRAARGYSRGSGRTDRLGDPSSLDRSG